MYDQMQDMIENKYRNQFCLTTYAGYFIVTQRDCML